MDRLRRLGSGGDRARFFSLRRRLGGGGGTRTVANLAEQGPHSDGLAILGGDLGEHAGGRRGHLDGHLVGLELHQRLVDRDGVARMLEPFSDSRLGHRFAERGNPDVSHVLILLASWRDQ